jgi:hypothetical protein
LEGRDVLEFICAPLPFASQLDAHLDAAEQIFLSPLIVDSQLEHVAVLQGCGARLGVGAGQPDVIEEGSRGARRVADEELL